MSRNPKPSIRPPSTAAARPSRSSIRPPSTSGAGPSRPPYPMPSAAAAGPSRPPYPMPSAAAAGPSRPPYPMPSTAAAGPSRPPDPVDEFHGSMHLMFYAEDAVNLPGFYPALEYVDTQGNDLAVVMDDAKAVKGLHIYDPGQGVCANGSNGGQGHATNNLVADKGKGVCADDAKGTKQGTLDRGKGVSGADENGAKGAANRTLLDQGKEVVNCCAKGKEVASVAPKTPKWASVLNTPAGNMVLTRSYPLGETTDTYFRFLHGMCHRNVVQARHQVNRENKATIVFKHKYDMTLRRYLEVTRSHLLCTGTNKDDRIQRDFQDLMISILRQTALGVDYYQDVKGIDCGRLSLDFIFLKFVPDKPPRVYVMLECYEKRAFMGKSLNIKNATDGTRHRTWGSYGVNVVRESCDRLEMLAEEANEIFALIKRCESKLIRSFRDFDTDPALIMEQKKLDLVSDSFQGVIMHKREDFFTKPPTHPCPKELLDEPWTTRFCYVIRNLKKEIRITYEADDANNYFHLWRFLRNVIEHIFSHEGLQNHYGNGASFIRFVRVYYPTLFKDLIHMVTVNYTGRTANTIVRRLKKF